MEARYPLFILEKDDLSVRMIKDSSELSWYEQIDIEEGLYVGWDVFGHPLELFWERKIGPQIRLVNDSRQIDKLKESILNYANLARPRISFVYFGPKDDVVALYKAAEEHIKAGRSR